MWKYTFHIKILQYTCFNCTCYTCSYDKCVWDMSQHNKLSDIQYARFQILPVDLQVGLFWSAGIPTMYHISNTMSCQLYAHLCQPMYYMYKFKFNGYLYLPNQTTSSMWPYIISTKCDIKGYLTWSGHCIVIYVTLLNWNWPFMQ